MMGFFDSITRSLVGSFMSRAMKREAKNDPEFRKSIENYQTKMAQYSKEIEDAIADIESRHGPIKRGGEWTCLKCGKKRLPEEIDVCTECGTNFQKYSCQLNEERKKVEKERKKLEKEEREKTSEAEKATRIIREKEKDRGNRS